MSFPATDGDAYERHMGRWSRQLAEVFLDFAGVGDHESVLDLGCGTGSAMFALARRRECRIIYGVDVSEAYIEYARERNDEPRVEFRVGDAVDIPLNDNCVDRVLSLLMLSFVADTQQALKEMRRVARPGGIVAAAVLDARGGHVTNRIFWDTAAVADPSANEYRARNFTRPMTHPGELATAWKQAGFENIEAQEIATRMNFKSFEDFWSPHLGKQGVYAEYIGSLSPEALNRLRGLLRSAYLDGEEDGPRSFACVAHAVKGTVPAE